MKNTFNSAHEMWTEIDTLLDALEAAANLTAQEQGRLTEIKTDAAAVNYWKWSDVNDFLYILRNNMTRWPGASD